MIYLSDDTIGKLFPNISKFGKAQLINDIANDELKVALEVHNREKEHTMYILDELNKRKCKVIASEIAQFVEYFSRIKNIDFNEANGLTDNKQINFEISDYTQMSNQVLDLREFIEKAIVSYGLGGILIGSAVMHKKAETAMNYAMSYKSEVQAKCELLKSYNMEMKAIRDMAKQENNIIRKLARVAKKPLSEFSMLVNKKSSWDEFTIEEKKMTASLMGIIKLIKSIIDQPVISEDGNIEGNAKKLINQISNMYEI